MLQNQDDEDENENEYSEAEDGDNDHNDEIGVGDSDIVTRTMPNDNTGEATTSRDARLDDTQNTSDNQNLTGHHMKNSPSDEEFYGGTTTGVTVFSVSRIGILLMFLF